MTRGALAETGLCRRPDGEQPLPERLSPSLGMKNKKQLKTRGRKKKKKNLSFSPCLIPPLHSPTLDCTCLMSWHLVFQFSSPPLLHAIPSPPCPHWLFLLASPFLLRPMFFPLALTMLRERAEGKKREKEKGPSRYVFFFAFFF